jgi:hypothetical protein
VEAIEKIQK